MMHTSTKDTTLTSEKQISMNELVQNGRPTNMSDSGIVSALWVIAKTVLLKSPGFEIPAVGNITQNIREALENPASNLVPTFKVANEGIETTLSEKEPRSMKKVTTTNALFDFSLLKIKGRTGSDVSSTFSEKLAITGILSAEKSIESANLSTLFREKTIGGWELQHGIGGYRITSVRLVPNIDSDKKITWTAELIVSKLPEGKVALPRELSLDASYANQQLTLETLIADTLSNNPKPQEIKLEQAINSDAVLPTPLLEQLLRDVADILTQNKSATHPKIAQYNQSEHELSDNAVRLLALAKNQISKANEETKLKLYTALLKSIKDLEFNNLSADIQLALIDLLFWDPKTITLPKTIVPEVKAEETPVSYLTALREKFDTLAKTLHTIKARVALSKYQSLLNDYSKTKVQAIGTLIGNLGLPQLPPTAASFPRKIISKLPGETARIAENKAAISAYFGDFLSYEEIARRINKWWPENNLKGSSQAKRLLTFKDDPSLLNQVLANKLMEAMGFAVKDMKVYSNDFVNIQKSVDPLTLETAIKSGFINGGKAIRASILEESGHTDIFSAQGQEQIKLWNKYALSLGWDKSNFDHIELVSSQSESGKYDVRINLPDLFQTHDKAGNNLEQFMSPALLKNLGSSITFDKEAFKNSVLELLTSRNLAGNDFQKKLTTIGTYVYIAGILSRQ